MKDDIQVLLYLFFAAAFTAALLSLTSALPGWQTVSYPAAGALAGFGLREVVIRYFGHTDDVGD